ncbi:hypothetical protein C8Q75DRAFT_45704 [Abortiporus biennis]|nr:hypothetical protein C8Q75DRAFT_45704 [Abortiporus biennis]
MVNFTGVFTILATMAWIAFAEPSRIDTAKRAAETTHIGEIAFYDVGGVEGTCGHTDSDSYPAVSMSYDLFKKNGRTNCDQWMHITNPANGESAYGRVRNYCDGCGAEYDLDLSRSLFQSLAGSEGLSIGRIYGIEWNFEPIGFQPPN